MAIITRIDFLVAVFFFTVIAIIVAVWRVYSARDDGSPMRWGAALMGLGLVSYLFARTHSSFISTDSIETLRNFFIITAGVGANMLAGGAMINIGKIRSNGAAYRRYPGKRVISQSFFGRVLVFTIVDRPKGNNPIK